MSWDIELAKKFRKQIRRNMSGSFSGTVSQVNPLIVSAYDGELILQGERVRVSNAIGALNAGDTVCIVGTGPYTIVARV